MAGLRTALVVALTLLLTAYAAAGTIGWIKANCHDGDIVEASGIVTAAFPDCIYMEDKDRAAGMRVRGFQGCEDILYIFASNGTSTGMRVATGSDGEKELVYLPNTLIASIWMGAPAPLMLQNRSLGGGDFCLNPATGQGQKGTCGGCGLNNVGLLLKTCGRVNEVNQGERWFYINDGSCRCGGAGHKGVRVDYSDWNYGHPVVVGNFCRVTGICTVINLDGYLHPVIKLRR